jgi:hypothetical protein
MQSQSPNANTALPSVQDWMYRAAIVLVLIETFYGLFWFLLGVVVRLDLMPNSTWIEANDFIASVGLWQEIAFHLHVFLNLVCVYLIIMRRSLVTPVYIVSFFIGKIDFILLADNPTWSILLDWDAPLRVVFFNVIQAITMVILAILSSRRYFR